MPKWLFLLELNNMARNYRKDRLADDRLLVDKLRLTPTEYATAIKRWGEGKSNETVAVEMECHERTVRRRMKGVAKKFRKARIPIPREDRSVRPTFHNMNGGLMNQLFVWDQRYSATTEPERPEPDETTPDECSLILSTG